MELVFENLACGYGGATVISGLNGALSAGACVALTGANGSGKTTLLQTLAGQLKPQAGAIETSGMRMGLLRQAVSINPEVPMTVLAFATMGLWPSLGLFGRPCVHQRDQVHAALLAVGLAGQAHHSVHTLSGGQRHRLGLARLLVQNPDVLLLDEPFAAADDAAFAAIRSVIVDAVSRGRIVIASLHEAELPPCFGHRLHLVAGQGQWSDLRASVRPDAPFLRVIAGGAQDEQSEPPAAVPSALSGLGAA